MYWLPQAVSSESTVSSEVEIPKIHLWEQSRRYVMARSENQKLKLLYILKCLEEKSDEDHPVSTKEIIDYLDGYDIALERKTLYKDIALLTDFGYDILSTKAKENSGYYLASRSFELAELKLLADAVASSKFITAKKTKDLLDKIGLLTSKRDAAGLRRRVYVDRIKNDNESIYYSVDDIHRAMGENRQIKFVYYEWGTDKVLHPRKDGAFYEVSPFFLIWKGDYYYLIAYDEESEKTKYYRVDKMKELSMSLKPRSGHEITGSLDPMQIAERDFSMFAGSDDVVTLSFPEEMVGVVIDRFGKDISLRTQDDGCRARVNVSVSPQFFGWLSGFSGKIKIAGPEEVVESYRDYLKNLLDLY